ncbi:MAG: F0F1 ATP synthase subunit delta [bacterium]|nr:F0F1 ATP synthase subunit delta [bacterium]
MENQQDPGIAILKTIASTEDASYYIEQIDRFLQSMYQTDRTSILTVLEEMLPENISRDIKEYLISSKIDVTHQEQVRYALGTLQDTIRKAKVVSLTIAFPASKRIVEKIASQVKESFGSNLLVEISINQELVGGAVIIYKGNYIDLSVKRKVDILFDAKKEEILKFLA